MRSGQWKSLHCSLPATTSTDAEIDTACSLTNIGCCQSVGNLTFTYLNIFIISIMIWFLLLNCVDSLRIMIIYVISFFQQVQCFFSTMCLLTVDFFFLPVVVAATNQLGGGMHDFKGKICVCFVINEPRDGMHDIKIHGVTCMVFSLKKTNTNLMKYTTGVVFSVHWRSNHYFPTMK